MKKHTIEDLKKVMVNLRGPGGCPWDKEQTPESLTPYAVEEALELEDAILHKSQQDVLEELGDLLFQVIFQAQMAAEKKQFDFDDVVDHLTSKMIHRHPHVLNKKLKSEKMTSIDVKHKWEKDKNKKKTPANVFSMPRNFPALLAAFKIGKKSRSIRFDWEKTQDIFAHFLTEVDELKAAIRKKDKANQMEEIGDALFTLVQVARHLSIDPEKALRLSNKKIVGRILDCFKLSKLSWPEFSKMPESQKEDLWKKVKKQNRKNIYKSKNI